MKFKNPLTEEFTKQDISGKLTFVNDNFKEIVQLEEDEISTKSLLHVYPDDKERVIANGKILLKKTCENSSLTEQVLRGGEK